MNCISFREKTGVFVLETKSSMYQMQVDQYGVLFHLYYGANVGDTEITNGLTYYDRGFSGNPAEVGAYRTYSLDVLPQEYTAEGSGDYRINGLELEMEDGSNAAYLRYESYEILPGKYSLSGMPAMFGNADEAQTLKITLCDKTSGVKVHLLYGVFPELDVITRAVQIENTGEETVKVKKVSSFVMDFQYSDMDMVHFHGRHAMEKMKERLPLAHSIHRVESKRGVSSHVENPFVMLCDSGATETSGDCYGFSLVYSGNFLFEAAMDQYDQIRCVMGIHPYHFCYALQKGEVFESPEAVMVFSGEGFTKLSHIYHDAFRSNLIRSKYVDTFRPVLINNWEATYFDFTADKLLEIAKEAKEIGLDMFVLDDGWFGKRDTDDSGLGDWYVNEDKIKGGLPALVKKIRGMGLKFGFWIEPEMISEDSDLYRAHPEWCLKIPNRDLVRGRNQLNLDVSRKDARDYIMDMIFEVMDACEVDYIKWDMNRSLANVYSAAVPKERQGEVYHRYVLGVYDMMERMVQRYPDLLFENCSGGGGRFDAGMLYYSPQIWGSDNTDAVNRIKIQYGTSFCYPISTVGSHVSVCPNHQTGRETSFETRGIVASAGSFGYELDLRRMTQEEKDMAKQQILEYKKMELLVKNGDYYRLTDPFTDQNYAAWQFVSKDKKETIVDGVMIRCEGNPLHHILKMAGLDPKAHYREEASGKIYTGAALMKAGIQLLPKPGEYQAFRFRFLMV